MKRAKSSKKHASPIKMPKGSNRRTFVKRKRNFNSQVYLKKINTQEEGNYSLITSPL